MTVEWNDNQPIYRQLRDMVVERIMDGSFSEGEAVPSVRQVAADYQINHLTVGKAYQELVEVGLLEKRRGLGMFVTSGARGSLTNNEQQRFIDEDVPAFAQKMQRLGLDMDEIVTQLRASVGDNSE
ncbi:MAG: GntR family transcriptional regulator [Halieaceae bacterium]